jgi:hypothetical protein
MKLETLKRCRGEVALAEIQILIALIMNPSEHGVIDSFSILFNGGNKILDNSIILHLAFPFCQVGIHVIAGDEIKLIIDAVFF